MTNIEKSLALINSFSDGDTDIAKKNLNPDYIQHNLNFGTGRENFIAAVEALQQAPVATTVKNIRSFEDGEFVILQSLYNFAGSADQIGIDVFRFDNDTIVEHWDNLTNIEGTTPSGHTQFDGPTQITDLEKTAENKALVSNFVRDVLRNENPSNITSYFDGDNYIQHNVGIADGLSGLSEALSYMTENNIDMVYDKTFKILGQGNFVLAMSEGSFDSKHVAFYDLFRVANNKIAEHWDIIQEIPKQEDWQNKNGKF